MKTLPLKIIMPVLLLAVHGAHAAIQLEVTGQNELQISDSSGKTVATVPAGELRQTVKADGHTFQTSYGKNIYSKPLIIIYADPHDTGKLELQWRSHRFTVSKSTLVIVLEEDGGLLLQSGMQGSVTVTPAPASSMRIYGAGNARHPADRPYARGQEQLDDHVRQELEDIINDAQNTYKPDLRPHPITPVTP
jgi:hypothetical protein